MVEYKIEYGLFGEEILEPVRKRFYSEETLREYTPLTFFRNAKAEGLWEAIKKDLKLTIDSTKDFRYD